MEAAGVEPASLTNQPAATTCLVGESFLLCDNVRTRVALPSPHGYYLDCRAQTPRFNPTCYGVRPPQQVSAGERRGT